LIVKTRKTLFFLLPIFFPKKNKTKKKIKLLLKYNDFCQLSN